MKNLHFYIQSILVLLALSFAVQIPNDKHMLDSVILIEFILGVYQLGMSFMLMFKLSKKSKLLKLYFKGSLTYIFSLIVLLLLDMPGMNEWWEPALLVFPWAFAILFLVTIDDLERARHYRL